MYESVNDGINISKGKIISELDNSDILWLLLYSLELILDEEQSQSPFYFIF